MTTIAGVSSSSTTAEAVTASKADAKQASLDYDAFLKLLVAQMQNQDPLNPTDATQQLSQLAAFSNVEQSIKVNQKLESMMTLSSLNQADAVIGRTLTSGDGTVTGIVKSVQVTDAGPVATMTNGQKLTLGSGVTVE
ncbi:flagellar basal body rod modification protein [Aureimonas sp. Leaf454]|uniref:flagellar hook assembly protein FlgD n=1 Tax=Aureimonas sp. Leaf454 TaxID=1736381 RepID=UPI0006F2B645|nr:flagellar hook assembly protein FlgD [Aureimonas sp. Leaf454]KQT45168.1 flagellar basal body rod modification protein [Aureimonas sp. Leaf454]